MWRPSMSTSPPGISPERRVDGDEVGAADERALRHGPSSTGRARLPPGRASPLVQPPARLVRPVGGVWRRSSPCSTRISRGRFHRSTSLQPASGEGPGHSTANLGGRGSLRARVRRPGRWWRSARRSSSLSRPASTSRPAAGLRTGCSSSASWRSSSLPGSVVRRIFGGDDRLTDGQPRGPADVVQPGARTVQPGGSSSSRACRSGPVLARRRSCRCCRRCRCPAGAAAAAGSHAAAAATGVRAPGVGRAARVRSSS